MSIDMAKENAKATDLNDKVARLNTAIHNLQCAVFYLDGSCKKEYLVGDGTVEEQLNAFCHLGNEINRIFIEISKDHGNEQCPTMD